MADYERAVEARGQWLQAIADGRDHAFVSAKWDAYRAAAGDLLPRIEANAAEDERITDMLRDRYDLPVWVDENDDIVIGNVEGDPPDLNREGDPAWNGAFDRW